MPASFDILTYVIPTLFALCFGGLVYALVDSLKQGADSYAKVYAEEASRELENLFLFIPAQRIANIARISALALFLLFFFIFADLDGGWSWAIGAFLGSLFAGIALVTPSLLVKNLRQRRLKKFNLQLVDALINMSNALKAGFSIAQAFESVVKEGENPIAQEFGVFLQQTRIGVRFEDALVNMEERVKSQDLEIMIRSIEIARQTGGNLTEVFEKIAETIRARMQIEGKIDAMTAMGRMQGMVVGLIPLALMGAMTMLDPAMMVNFFTSIQGIAILVLVGMLEIVGFLIIRKIVNIDV
jgi:tight adherence protein B